MCVYKVIYIHIYLFLIYTHALTRTHTHTYTHTHTHMRARLCIAYILYTIYLLYSNSKMFPTKLFDTSFRVSIASNGEIIWFTAGTVTTSCNMDIRYFPFDIQTCYIHIER